MELAIFDLATLIRVPACVSSDCISCHNAQLFRDLKCDHGDTLGRVLSLDTTFSLDILCISTATWSQCLAHREVVSHFSSR